MNDQRARQSGFTIVELLIVIVIVSILAAITIVAYNGIQDRARQTKVQTDLAQIEKAVIAARINQNKPLFDMTGNGWTAEGCASAQSGTDLTNTSIATVASCWEAYNDFLEVISNASGVNITAITDPWGRPYYVDENENQNGGSCTQDVIAAYHHPHAAWSFTNERNIPNSMTSCL